MHNKVVPKRPWAGGSRQFLGSTRLDEDTQLDVKRFLDVYRAMAIARRIDEVELELTNRGEAFFHVAAYTHRASTN